MLIFKTKREKNEKPKKNKKKTEMKLVRPHQKGEEEDRVPFFLRLFMFHYRESEEKCKRSQTEEFNADGVPLETDEVQV
jgi:hypothetical protein